MIDTNNTINDINAIPIGDWKYPSDGVEQLSPTYPVKHLYGQFGVVGELLGTYSECSGLFLHGVQ